jgi:glycosyltransferase involved in cell wall biosynthesis
MPKRAAPAAKRPRQGRDGGTPALTVGICNYNYARYLGRAIESALGYADEVVVYDDASTDDSAGVAARYPIAGLIRAEHNAGPVAGFNALIERARSRWLCILDSDNFLLRVPKLYGDYVYGDIVVVGESGERQSEWDYAGWPESAVEARDRFMTTHAMPIPSGGFWRREWIGDKRYRYWPSTRFGFDFQTMLDWLRHDPEIHHDPGPTLAFRQHQGQQTADFEERFKQDRNADEWARSCGW